MLNNCVPITVTGISEKSNTTSLGLNKSKSLSKETKCPSSSKSFTLLTLSFQSICSYSSNNGLNVPDKEK